MKLACVAKSITSGCLTIRYNYIWKGREWFIWKSGCSYFTFLSGVRQGDTSGRGTQKRLNYSPVLLLSLGHGSISICFIRVWLFNETLGLLLQEKPWSPRKWTRICWERRRKPGDGDKKPSRRLSPCDGHERKAVLFHIGADPAPTALQWQQPAVPMGLATVSTQWWKYNFTVSRDTGETVRVHEYCSKGI